ncbi:MAG: hypothetical protein CMI55_02105 [Parcubacteria group bacterium]|jgi:DNA polymerase-3 subunit delta'|nr:hypothetical protein [Parcubacteria group bacterium]|tara:strand:+ start:190 stop:1086 length:897 start_codon:yes stop_codon:yes gene_type:complete
MVIGHQRILDFFKKSIKNNRLAHAYLFTGSAYLGKRTVALEFIKMLIGGELDKTVHPDVHIAEPESVISIKQIREIQHQMSLFPYQAPYKIVLIDQADKMTAQASNCFLKTLEEPTGKAILILITSKPKSLLSTIISRCQQVNFLSVNEKEIEKGLESMGQVRDLKRIVRLANGRPGLAVRYSENPELLKNQAKIINQLEELLKADLNRRYQYIEKIAKDLPLAQQVLEHWLFWFRDLLLLSVGCADRAICPVAVNYKDSYSLGKIKSIIQAIRRTSWLLANPSINAQLALEVLVLEF